MNYQSIIQDLNAIYREVLEHEQAILDHEKEIERLHRRAKEIEEKVDAEERKRADMEFERDRV
jgi:hypothetical protein